MIIIKSLNPSQDSLNFIYLYSKFNIRSCTVAFMKKAFQLIASSFVVAVVVVIEVCYWWFLSWTSQLWVCRAAFACTDRGMRRSLSSACGWSSSCASWSHAASLFLHSLTENCRLLDKLHLALMFDLIWTRNSVNSKIFQKIVLQNDTKPSIVNLHPYKQFWHLTMP